MFHTSSYFAITWQNSNFSAIWNIADAHMDVMKQPYHRKRYMLTCVSVCGHINHHSCKNALPVDKNKKWYQNEHEIEEKPLQEESETWWT